MAELNIATREDKKSFWRKFIESPWVSYQRIGSIIFGICLSTNITTAVYSSIGREFIHKHTDVFFWSIFVKSIYFGLIWPSFIYKSIFNPSRVFIIYEGITKSGWDSLYDQSDQLDSKIGKMLGFMANVCSMM